MKLLLGSILFCSLFSATPAFAEWTGDKVDGMVSSVTINKIHVGQIDGSPYFCFSATTNTGSTTSACQVKSQSNWKSSFDMFYNQVMYYYSTGQKVRVYYEPYVWSYEPFTESLSSNVLVGLSTCESDTQCYGPERKKP